jgi:squalene-associated FAD-dependent desaturase
MKPRIAIIGAGWAGLAAAVELVAAADVTVFEAGRAAGGRARRVRDGQYELDNGQHILLGAYRECLRLMHKVGVDPAQVLHRLPLSWVQTDGLAMRCPRLPAPLHLLVGLFAAKGLSGEDKRALAGALAGLRLRRWRVRGNPTVAEWLAAHGQNEALQASFWRPLVLSALNTPLEIASMCTLALVLRDSLGATRAASDLLLPARNLSEVFPDPACAWLREQGAALRFGRRVTALGTVDGGVRVEGETFDAALVACAPYHAAQLLAEENCNRIVKALQFLPIYTVYLCFDRSPRLPEPMLGVKDGMAHWLFDREALCGEAGMLAAVISAPLPEQLPAEAALIAGVLADVRRAVPDLPDPVWTRVLAERRATFASTPDLVRAPLRADAPGLYLAGDWVGGDYPATLEGAVRSGTAAARSLLQDLQTKNP